MKSFYEMIMILEDQQPQDQQPQDQQPQDQQPQDQQPQDHFPPEIEQERQIRMKMSVSDQEERIFDIILDALNKAGVNPGADEFNMLYGKEVDMTLFTHHKGPYSGIERVSGVIYPKKFETERIEYKYETSPVGYEINGKKFHPHSIAAIHSISHYESLDQIEQDAADEDDYYRTREGDWRYS